MPASPPTIHEVVGRNVRRLREERELSQDALAARCRHKGLSWGRSSITLVEAGTKRCDTAALLILASALDAPLTHLFHGTGPALLSRTTAADLEHIVELIVAADYTLAPGLADSIGVPQKATPRRAPRRPPRRPPSMQAERAQPAADVVAPARLPRGEADQSAARALHLSVKRLDSLCHRLWGCSFTEAREARYRHAFEGEGVPPEAARALRGHISRELLAELRAVLGEDAGGAR